MVSQFNPQQQPILEARNLTMHFHTGGALSRKTVKAVQQANLKLYSGRVTALVGESGSGKSTIIRMLARLYTPTDGQIIFRGEDALRDKSRRAALYYRSQVQMIFQDPFSSLNPVHQVKYHLERPLRIHGKARSRAALNDQIDVLLKRVSLTPTEEFAVKYPHQLSGGQRQRVAIARALAVQPEVILADEPVSMLDVSIRMGILNLMAVLRDEQNIAFLYVTHDIASARYFADETLVMYAGFIVEGAGSEELIQEPKHPYTQLLLSAVPDPARGLRTAEVEVVGEIPSLTSLGAGCPFANRCSRVMEKCKTVMPSVTELSPTRWVRCFLYE
ncbi:MAG: ABC transporter ATP-binding protein [Chloroflexota bacterium]|jgi:peptide/nickel transport system ATP-binding protein|nr:MAG: ABC transporter ATP-binding protein [Chloroflexota bacterium]